MYPFVKFTLEFLTLNQSSFQVLRKSHQLKMGGELGLMSAVLEDGRFHLRQYGHLVSNALVENNDKNIAMAALFASNYWRIIGNPHEAIECQKKALHLAPRIWKFAALLSMANILHRTHHSEDAVTVLHKAIEITPDNPALHFTLGNIQATLLNFNESSESFSNAITLQPNFEAAKRRRHAVFCHQKVERALEEQQHALQETLNELRHYKKQHDKWTQLLNKIINEQASFETRMQATIGYEHSKLRIQMSENEKRRRSKLHQRGVNNSKWKVDHRANCAQTNDEDGNIYLTCSVLPSDGNELENQIESFNDRKERGGHHDLNAIESKNNENNLDTNDVDLLLRKFESRITEFSESPSSNEKNNIEEESVHDNGTNKRANTNDEKGLKDDYSIRPTLPEKYPNFPEDSHNKAKDDNSWHLKKIFGSHWPTKEACDKQNLKREWNEYPTVFLSPENKGFE